MDIDFYVEIGKKEKKKFDFIYMDINGHRLLCRNRKKGKEKDLLHLYRMVQKLSTMRDIL